MVCSIIIHALSPFMSLSRGIESLFTLLTREIEDLKSKLMTKTDELNESIKRNSEVCMHLAFSCAL